MRYTKSKHFVRSELGLSKDPSLDFVSCDFKNEEDDPFNIRSLSITSLGITIAILTILLPSIGVILGRPFSQGDEIIFNQSIKKDGS